MRHTYLPTIAELQAFTACARHGTTTRAAFELNLTQSAISRALGTLEARLGVALFHRVRKRLVLSPAGQGFLERAEQALATLDAAAVGAMAFGGTEAVLRIAALPSFTRSWLIARLARFAQIAPQISLDITARLHPVEFERDPFDLAIMRTQHERAGTRLVPLLRESLVAVCAPERLAGNEPLAPEALLGHPLLQQSTRPTLWLDWFRDTGLDARDILRGARFDHFDMILDAAIAGMGIGLVPEIIARASLTEGRLVRACARTFETGGTYSLIIPERTEDTPSVATFQSWLLAELRAD
ncbi:LysR family transcriptional regulator [Thioclava dalianensis]|uniref:LysR family transcriptional regulator n=1 Tax=Thioclava dalianensis TaxID=1185766 RepID=A0A074TK11_9RHOB|nr:LysR substrate-binding domain-containing protein [Thioclava dalianensis]KEP70515.1 LysR family transcriptional regulator [Thioclava dalianensis]SFN08408.1 DNA-binding transcriptional regulator, LysR family [Thioclava dalianensis]